ncbi:MAG TPA: hypothetical protein PKC38_07065 [Chitinophagales bacterium]|nr:hypothetical protein [Chitinophagales bacterium]HMY35633.1 hypothetical protein [bacterium]HNA14593.1 hypothetical protein [Cyclobacteriaceae bacterium]
MAYSDDFILPFFHKEFSSATRDWTDAEVGAYTRLLIFQWDQGSIPEDINRIRKIADSIDQTGAIVLPKFAKAEQDGRLQNLNMEKIRTERKIFRAKKSESGKEGASKRWQTDGKHDGKSYSKHDGKHIAFNNEVEVEEEVKVIIEGEVKEVVPEKKRFSPPTIDEATIFFSLNRPDHWSTDHMKNESLSWFDHYSSNGWKVGGNKMRDWKAAARKWIRNDYNFEKNKNGNNIGYKKSNGVSEANMDKLRRIVDGDF